MKSVSLLLVLLLAKLLVLAGRPLSWSWWLPIAFIWQDVLIVLVFALFEAITRTRAWISWSLYGLLLLYVALNVGVARVLSTPLTWMMLRATSGTLADSIRYYLTWVNLLLMTSVLLVGIITPLALERFGPKSWRRGAIAAIGMGVAVVALGPHASARVATYGLHRNALMALVLTALPRVDSTEYEGQWRVSPFGSRDTEDLSRHRGTAHGRNVVIIHLESTGAQYLRPHGASEDPMPYLTEISRHAILFENAYTTYPETIRSFFAVQCATWPALDTTPEEYEGVQVPGLATVLGQHGYRTGLFHSGRFAYLGMNSVLHGRGYDTLEDAGDIGGERDSSFGIDEESAVHRILEWIDDNPAPFLVSYLPIAGHHPYYTPAGGPFSPTTEINRYRNALHYSDACVRELITGLQKRGLDGRTLIIIIGDHAEAFEQHAGNNGHTFFLYEENVRVPFLILAPGLIEDSIRVERVASLVDTAPTVLDLLGLSIPNGYQGRTLLDGHEEMALFCTEYSLLLVGLRDERWKVVYELDTGRALLFDLSDDPEEKNDLSGQFPARTAAYADHLRRWAATQKHWIKHH
jgi:phosphoglycerol transferase MdoB-like AlkP superfamily enzyme